MSRRNWLQTLTCSLAWVFDALTRAARGDEQEATLNETLRSILKCRRPEEFAYVDLITQKVEQGQLPRPLVLSMMDWARKRSRQEVSAGRRKNDFPFPYFQEGLRIRAAEINVSLPAFNPNVAF
jgi:hypothetical protein